MSHYLIGIIHKTVKPSHLEKLQIIQNINKLILIKQIIVSSTSFVLAETDFQKILEMHKFNDCNGTQTHNHSVRKRTLGQFG